MHGERDGAEHLNFSAIDPQAPQSRALLLVNGAADRADTKPGPAEIQMVGALGPFSRAHTKDVLGMNRLNFAHRNVAASTGLQTGIVVLTLAGLFEHGRRNFEHYMNFPAKFSSTVTSTRGRVLDKYQICYIACQAPDGIAAARRVACQPAGCRER